MSCNRRLLFQRMKGRRTKMDALGMSNVCTWKRALFETNPCPTQEIETIAHGTSMSAAHIFF